MTAIRKAIKCSAPVLCGLLMSLSASAQFGYRPAAAGNTAAAQASDVIAIERAARGQLLAVGRLDSISRSQSVASVLGQEFVLLADPTIFQFVERAEVGQAVAFFGELVGNQYFVDSAMILPGSYVQGASMIFLRGQLTSVRHDVGAFSIGRLDADFTSSSHLTSSKSVESGSLIDIIGSQPSISGKILVEQFARVTVYERDRPDASVGTGKGASVGTGRPNASVGTGRLDALGDVERHSAE